MSKYLVSLGIVWVVISLILGVVLVSTSYTTQEKSTRVSQLKSDNNYRSLKRSEPIPKITSVQTSVQVGDPNVSSNGTRTSVQVLSN